jgi:hypothetical protein
VLRAPHEALPPSPPPPTSFFFVRRFGADTSVDEGDANATLDSEAELSCGGGGGGVVFIAAGVPVAAPPAQQGHGQQTTDVEICIK